LQLGEQRRLPRLGVGEPAVRALPAGGDVRAQLGEVGPAGEQVVDARPELRQFGPGLVQGVHAASIARAQLNSCARSRARSRAASSAASRAARTPWFSSSRMALMVVPAGEVTASL